MPFNSYNKHHGYSKNHAIQLYNKSSMLYIAYTLRQLGLSVAGIYLPIYIYQISNKPNIITNPINNGILFIILFFALRAYTSAIMTTFVSDLIFSKIRFKMSFFISLVFLSIYMISWYYSKDYSWLLIITAISLGVQDPFYWIPYHTFFARKINNKEKHMIEDKIKTRILMGRVAGVIGPFIGGVLITRIGFQFAILTGIAILFLSFPFFAAMKEDKHHSHKFIDLFKIIIKDKSYYMDIISFSALEIESILYSIFWPMLLFLSAFNIEQLGFITSITLIASMISTVWAAKLIKKQGKAKIHITGTLLNATLHMLRSIILIPMGLLGIEVIDRINSPFYAIPISAKIYEDARGLHSSNFIIFRNFALQTTTAITLTFIAMFLTMADSWKFVFFIAAIASVLTALISISKFKHITHISRS